MLHQRKHQSAPRKEHQKDHQAGLQESLLKRIVEFIVYMHTILQQYMCVSVIHHTCICIVSLCDVSII